MSQFLCLKNIRWFLNCCRVTFGMREGDLFEPYDLFDLKDFKKVMNTLSKLSRTEVALQKGSGGFQHQEEDIYKNLEELQLEMPDEDIYGPIATEEEGDKIYEDLCSFKNSRASVMSRATIDKKTKSDFCIEEILVTEKNYVDALQMISEKFMKHLEPGVLNADQMSTIFMNIQDLYTTHKEIYSQLKAAVEKSPEEIAVVFITFKKKMVGYAEYCAGLPAAQNKVDELMKRNDIIRISIQDCEQQANDGRFKLRDLLVVPMQRVMKYGLLLHELKKNLDKDKMFDKASPQMKQVEKGISVMQDIAYYVNEVKRDRESLETISMIEQSIEDLSMPPGTKLDDYGHLLKDGELKVKFHDDNRELKRYIFLFDKVMLMCKSRGETYSYKTALVLHNYRLEDNQSGAITKVLQWRHSFMLVEKEDKTAITFFSKNEEQKRKWLDSITLAMDNFSPQFSKDGGHDFIMHTFAQATECDYCDKLLAGCFYQGYCCSQTKKKAHKQCIGNIVNRVGKVVKGVRHKAIYSYLGNPPAPSGKNVLTFSEGDVIEVENQTDPDWWIGSKSGVHGSFPSKYVQKVSSRGSVMSNGGAHQRYSNHPPATRTSSTSHRHSSTNQFNSSAAHLPPSPNRRHPEHDYMNTQSLSDYPWYIGVYNKTEASQKLNAQEDGVFLVRESKDRPGTYAIGIAYQGTAKHIKVAKSPDSTYSIADCKCFNSIPMLVQYYEQHTLQDSFPELTTTLLIPFNRVNHRVPRTRAGSSPSLINSSSPRATTRRSVPPIIGKAEVSFDYSSTEPNQINLQTGETVAVISKAGGDRGWWKGAVIINHHMGKPELGKIGYFPLAYVEEQDDDGTNL